MAEVIVVGGGHNGLVAACYMAQAGREVVVLEALDEPGGGARTSERLPGYRFDLHSVAHNMINMTDIPAELDLPGAGLVYQEMDPFSVAVHADGRRVRFHRSIDATVASIAESDPAEAEAYRRFMADAIPLVRVMVGAIRADASFRSVAGRLVDLVRVARQGPGQVLRDLLGSYDSLLRRRLPSDLTRGPVAAFAAHAASGPSLPGGAAFAFWQAAYHLHGQWHARGGAGALTDALVTRLRSLGGTVRCNTPVSSIDARSGQVVAVVTEEGERLACRTVVTACDPRVALLELLDPPLSGPAAAELAATRRGNVVQALIHVATDRLPPYPHARPGDWNGLQSFVDSLDDMVSAWAASEAGLLPDPLPLYAFTTSALDDTLAPAGHHAVYLACPAAPARVRGGWEGVRDRFVEEALDAVEARAPGFRDSVRGVAAWTPGDMMAAERWPGAHPMHLDIALDQLGFFRPTPRLAGHRTPVEGLYVSGAGTAPAGGVAGTPGRLAAQAVLSDDRRPQRQAKGTQDRA